MTIINDYRREVKERLSKKMEERYGTKSVFFLSLIFLVLVNGLIYFINYKFWGIDSANQSAISFLIGTLLLDFLIVLGFPLIWRFQEIPEEIYIDNKKKLDEKDKEIFELVEKGKILSSEKVSYNMGVLVQDFETKFNSITMTSSSQDIRRLFTLTGNILDDLIEDWIPKSRLVLVNADEVKNNIYSLNKIRNEFGESFTKFLRLKEKLEEWKQSGGIGITPKEIGEPLVEVSGILWGVNDEACFNVKMQSAIDSCLSELRKNIK